MSIDNWITKLRCPSTHLALTKVSLAEAEARVGSRLLPRESKPIAIGQTPSVLLREDAKIAYPILDDVPVLMSPESLESHAPTHDMEDLRWAEAYAEMEHYNTQALSSVDSERMAPLVRMLTVLAESETIKQQNRGDWVDSPYDAISQLEAFDYLGEIKGKRIAQIGGSGQQALKFLLAGAAEAWLFTPMSGEAIFARNLAMRFGVSSRFHCVIAIGEELPILPGYLDSVYMGGCLHHMNTALASEQIREALIAGGRFVAVEPWKTPLHTIGTRLLGKREEGAFCQPLTSSRIRPIRNNFDSVEVRHHGPLLRYLALGVCKISRREMSVKLGIRLTRVDDRLPIPSRLGGSVAVLATKAAD